MRTAGGDELRLTATSGLQALAMHWSYVVQQRQRWSQRSSARKDMESRAAQVLEELGLGRSALEKLARAELIEVAIPYKREEEGWEARILPWEFLLSAATRPLGRDAPLTVVRHLMAGRPAAGHSPEGLLHMEAAPGRLQEFYSYDAEFKLVESCLGMSEAPRLQSPTLTELRRRIEELEPDVVHISGIDTRLASRLLDEQQPATTEGRDGTWDGLLLRGENTDFAIATATDLASALNAAARKPQLVSFNSHYSGARLAALVVAEGAAASIGFQTDFDDSLAELFFANFYRSWRLSDWDLLPAFLQGRESLARHHRQLRGTGIILWSSRSLLQRTSSGEARGQPVLQQSRAVKEQLRQERSQEAAADGRPLRERVKVEVRPHQDVNYSLLHNRRSLFQKFTLRKLDDAQIRDLQLEVMLHVGSDTFPYRASLDLVEPSTELSDRIVVPLTSALARAVDENMQTTLYVRLCHATEILHHETHRVVLLPVDQWRDDDEDRCWLPSFVLPRSPAVAKIIASAQNYLKCLADSGGAGFDGYQSHDPDAEDPWAGVDRQVRAIWAALTFERPLGYINPPPTYRAGSQRLRTPEQVMMAGRGTCIDLALLLASCLEYIEVYPVLFLLEGHAFPGYWRSYESYLKFRELKEPLAPPSRPLAGPRPATSDRVPWMLGRDSYMELLQYVGAGDLVPLESVWLTHGSGFDEGVAEGANNLRSKRDFHSMTDIVLAREYDVTPLPL